MGADKIRLAVCGPAASGKSHTVNASAGARLLPEREPLDLLPRDTMPVMLRHAPTRRLLRVATPLPLGTYAGGELLSDAELQEVLAAAKEHPLTPPLDSDTALAARLSALLLVQDRRAAADDGLICFVAEAPLPKLETHELLELPPWGDPGSRAGLATQVVVRACHKVLATNMYGDDAAEGPHLEKLRRHNLLHVYEPPRPGHVRVPWLRPRPAAPGLTVLPPKPQPTI